MLFLTEDAAIVCKHRLGKVDLGEPIQHLVKIAGRDVREGRRVLVEKDPEGKKIGGCPNYGITIKPCRKTLEVARGYSALVRIEGRAVCLDSLRGITDGTPPRSVDYEVRAAGQSFVAEVP